MRTLRDDVLAGAKALYARDGGTEWTREWHHVKDKYLGTARTVLDAVDNKA